MFKRFRAVLAVLSLLLSLPGCGSSPGAAASVPFPGGAAL